MTALKYIWYALGLLFFPLRFASYILHRLFVFFSKPGAAFLMPALLAGAAFLLRTKIDGLAGVWITDQFWALRGHEDLGWMFDYRIEITFAAAFLLVAMALVVLRILLTPVVGALPAPRAPLVPLRPLIVREHVIAIQKASVAIRGKSSRFRGDLARLERYLSPQARDVLEAGKRYREQQAQSPSRAQSEQKERERPNPTSPERVKAEPAHLETGNGARNRTRPSDRASSPNNASHEQQGRPAASVEGEPAAETMEATHSQLRDTLEDSPGDQGRGVPANDRQERSEVPAQMKPPAPQMQEMARSRSGRTRLPPKDRKPAAEQEMQADVKPTRKASVRPPKERSTQDNAQRPQEERQLR
ncbi:hypothetical protein ATO13_23551 [Stappia sp. 22II-S9-Z10]|nr:hypothetical protein ATO13_23551 [Stappia sp. 22II-S9-Z10]